MLSKVIIIINFFFLACSAFVEKRKVKPNLIAAVLLKVLLLNGGAKEEDDVVNHVGGMLRQIQQHEIEVQSHNTTSFSWIKPKKKRVNLLEFQISNQKLKKRKVNYLLRRKFKMT